MGANSYFCSGFVHSNIMSDKTKRIFLAFSIFVPFLIYCVYYYSQMIKNAPFRFADFQSVELRYGQGDTLLNQYNSATGHYQYLDVRDSLITKNLKLSKDDLLYIHRKAAELGFWNLPEEMLANPEGERSDKTTYFFLELNYTEKSKSVLIDVAYPGNQKMLGTAKSVIDEVQRVINDAQDRKTPPADRD